jgi:hypothetical protein
MSPAVVPEPTQPPRQEPAPIASPSPLPPPPVRAEAQNRLITGSDVMPLPPPPSRAASAPSLDRSTWPSILSRLARRPVVVIAGGAVALLVVVIAIAAGDDADPSTRSAMSATKASSTRSPVPRPTHGTDVPSPPSSHDMPAAAAPGTTVTATVTATTTSAQARADSPAQPLTAEKPPLLQPAPRSPSTDRAPRAVAASPGKRSAAAAIEDDMPETARARAAYNAGNQALFAGHSDAAIRAYRQALSAAPTFPPGFRGLGLAYAQKGDNNLAIMALRTYLHMAPRARDATIIKQRIADLLAKTH